MKAERALRSNRQGMGGEGDSPFSRNRQKRGNNGKGPRGGKAPTLRMTQDQLIKLNVSRTRPT